MFGFCHVGFVLCYIFTKVFCLKGVLYHCYVSIGLYTGVCSKRFDFDPLMMNRGLM